jgi:hypothetical protein
MHGIARLGQDTVLASALSTHDIPLLDCARSHKITPLCTFCAMILLLSCPQVAHCSDISPIAKPGVRFACPEDTEYNPAQDLVQEPNEKKCCKVGH